MGVITTADERIDAAKVNIDNAIREVGDVIIDRCWGHEKYDSEKLRECLDMLLDLRDKLA